jgi:hypothetical protein
MNEAENDTPGLVRLTDGLGLVPARCTAGTARFAHNDDAPMWDQHEVLAMLAAERERWATAAEPLGWRVEYGAIGLHADDPARITGVLFYETEAEAAVACDEMDFNSIITPLYAKAGGPNG